MSGNVERINCIALQELCARLGVTFNRIELLQQAITHTSYANESKNSSIPHNERLEFLGDAVLDVIVSEYLFSKFPELPEGELTKARAAIVCEGSLARCATKLAIGEYLLLGKGEDHTGGRERASILADAFEAIVGAVYLDNGFAAAVSFVVNCFENDLYAVKRGEYTKDYKTLLQEVIQRESDSKVVYEIVSESGPDHNKTFAVIVTVNGIEFGRGVGKTKKEAEQNSAEQALAKIKE